MNKVLKSKNGSLYVILIAIVVLMCFLNPARFPTVRNFTSMAYQLPILAFLSIGMMITMLSGGINLAIVATSNFTGIVTMLALRAFMGEATADAPLIIALASLALGFAAALLIGAFSGFLIAYLDVPAILATLGVQMLLGGVNILLTKGYTLSGFPDSLLFIGNGTLAGVPLPFCILIVAVAIIGVLLKKTAFGFSLYMVGSNPIAAAYSNVKNRSIIMREYIVSAALAGVAAVIMMGQLNSVKANYWESYILVSVLACYLGGVDAYGGEGDISGIVLSVIILQVISSGVNLLRVDPFFVQAMWGFIVLALIAANKYRGDFRMQQMIRAAKRTAA